MITNLIKPYGILSLAEEDINVILLLFPFVNGFTRILWGYMGDIFGFKPVYLILLFIGVNFSFKIKIKNLYIHKI